MKTLLLIVALALGAISASAQHIIRGGGYVHRPPVIVRSYAPIYPYMGFYAPFGYYPGYNYYPGQAYSRPSKLDMKIDDIKSDYKDRIWSARHDSSLSHAERRTEVRRLKTERDQAIEDLKMNYYKRPAPSGG